VSKRQTKITKFRRMEVMRRDEFTCQWCGKIGCPGPYLNYPELEIDHITPVDLGGKNDHDNLQVLCCLCNKMKWNKHPEDRPTIEEIRQFHRIVVDRSVMRDGMFRFWVSPLFS
jgi:5-methylcytosine-specific restriction endonuclease McrA